MSTWLEAFAGVEALEGAELDAALVAQMQAGAVGELGRVNFYTPTFKAYATSEISGCGKSAWPAISVTGGDCKLQCDHCKAKILEPMIPARTPG